MRISLRANPSWNELRRRFHSQSGISRVGAEAAALDKKIHGVAAHVVKLREIGALVLLHSVGVWYDLVFPPVFIWSVVSQTIPMQQAMRSCV